MKLWKWIRTDGLLHIETSAILLIVIAVIAPLWLSAVVTLCIGIGKEIWDRYHNGVPSWHDVICDLIGISLGILLYLT